MAGRRTPIAAMAVTIVLVAGSATACGGDGGDGGGDGAVGAARAAQMRQLAADAGLPDDAADLLARAAAAVDATYRVTYEVSGDGTTEVVTVTADPPRRRVDTAGPEGDTARAHVSGPDGSRSCTREGGRWTCRPAPEGAAPGVFDSAALEAAVERLGEARSTHRFVVRRRRLAGADATCLVTEPRSEGDARSEGTLCVSPEGVPLLIDRPSGTVRATAYTTEVEPSQLEVPSGAGG